MFLFAVASWGGTYIITNSAGGFAATLSGVTVKTDADINVVLDAVRGHSDGEPATIQFGGDGGTAASLLDLGDGGMTFRNSEANNWGEITLTGSVTSKLTSPSGGVVVLEEGTATVISANIVNTGERGNALNVYRASTIVTIEGGTLTSYSNGSALVVANAAAVTLMGTARIELDNSSNTAAAISLQTGGTLYLRGGTVSNKAGNVAIECVSGDRGANGGAVYLGGSPTVNGTILLANSTYVLNPPIQAYASGAFAFNPGTKKYSIRREIPETGEVTLVNDGAPFVSNFTLAGGTPAGVNLAVNNNDLVATSNHTYSVSFDVNGAVAAPPTTIRVASGGTLGELVKPSTAPYISPATEACPNGCLAEDNWYEISAVGAPSALFDFGPKNIGTEITANKMVILKWTNTPVSVQEASRIVPAVQTPGTAAIAPITVLACELTVGPNPVAKKSGAVSFFWSGSAVKGGKLLVYDASGSLVKKISVNTAEKGAIASWDLTTAKGAPISDGTYVAKGVIKAKNGKTEKVSTLFSVR